MSAHIQVVEEALYAHFESQARRRIAARDEQDWPVIALALALQCAVWTEDADFFGSGVPTWTTRTVEFYLRRESLPAFSRDLPGPTSSGIRGISTQ